MTCAMYMYMCGARQNQWPLIIDAGTALLCDMLAYPLHIFFTQMPDDEGYDDRDHGGFDRRHKDRYNKDRYNLEAAAAAKKLRTDNTRDSLHSRYSADPCKVIGGEKDSGRFHSTRVHTKQASNLAEDHEPEAFKI